MPHQPSLEKSATVVDSAAAGAGAGAVVGLLSTVFRKDPKLKDYIKHTLIGGGVGAAAGAGLGGMRSKGTPAPPSIDVISKPKLDPTSAALAGAIPLLGPATYGAMKSQDGDRLANALKLGGGSMAGAMPVSMLAQMSGKTGLLSSLLAMGASAAGSGMMANHINKSGSALKAKFDQGASAVTKGINSLGDIKLNPLDPASGALAGGMGGAAVGGLGGLLKAILDSEDDGILGTLRKTLGGAAIGGAGGAALGGGYSAMRRNHLLAQLPEKQHGAVREIMGNYTVPLKHELARILGRPTNQYIPQIRQINQRAAFSHAVSPALVHALEYRAAHPRV